MLKQKFGKAAVGVLAAALLAVSVGVLAGCGGGNSGGGGGEAAEEATSEAVEQEAAPAAEAEAEAEAAVEDIDYTDWEAVLEAAKGTTVVYQGYDGNQQLNSWVNEDLTQAVKDKYDITLVYQNESGAMQALTDALAAGSTANDSSWDITWTNGTGFKNVQELGGWFGPINPLLPNFAEYYDPENPLVYMDFAYDNQGYEAPFGFYELNIIKDDEKAPGEIKTLEDFAELVKANPGKFTYQSSENWVGAAFIRTVIKNLCDYDALMTVDPSDTEKIAEIVEPAMAYLRDLNPYLWQEGQTFPATNDQMTELFKNGEIYNDILYDQYGCGNKINAGEYPESAHSYIFDNTTANFSYWAIPYNSGNKAGALVVINEMLSPEQQLAKTTKAAGDVLDHSKLDADMQAEFDAVDHGPNNQSDEALAAAAFSEYSGDVETAITQIWLDTVVGQTNDVAEAA